MSDFCRDIMTQKNMYDRTINTSGCERKSMNQDEITRQSPKCLHCDSRENDRFDDAVASILWWGMAVGFAVAGFAFGLLWALAS